MARVIVYVGVMALLLSCAKDPVHPGKGGDPSIRIPDCSTPVLGKNWVYVKDGRKWLNAGRDSSWHFDITAWSLNECRLNYGLGREHFKALIEPEYVPVGDASVHDYQDDDRFIIVHSDHLPPKVWSLYQLSAHEVINDVVDGDSIAVAYCILADLAAVYTREYCGKNFTFALSGYTYHDPAIWNGVDAFILWDRETESLWWPLIDQAVSGTMNATGLEKHDEAKWQETTWKDIRDNHPDALILKDGQTMDVPQGWPQYTAADLYCG